MRRLIIAAALLICGPALAFEEGDSYVGLQLGQSTIDLEDVDDLENPIGLIRIGIFATPSLAFEGRYGADLGDDTVSGVDYDIDRIASVFAIYHFNFGDDASSSVYGLFGYTEIDVKGNTTGDSINEKEDDVSYGIGVEINGFSLEFSQYIDRSDYDASAINLGYNYYFK